MVEGEEVEGAEEVAGEGDQHQVLPQRLTITLRYAHVIGLVGNCHKPGFGPEGAQVVTACLGDLSKVFVHNYLFLTIKFMSWLDVCDNDANLLNPVSLQVKV